MIGASVTRRIDSNVTGALRRAQRRRAEDAMAKGFAVSQERVPEDRGTLRQTAVPPEWRAPDEIAFAYTQPYAQALEEGTQPFQPPVQPLVEWAERVTGDPGLGYYVALEKIPSEGIDAQPYAEPGADAVARYLDANPLGDYLDDELG